MSAPALTVSPTPTGPAVTQRRRSTAALSIGLLAVLAALALPFAPVTLTETTVQWPAAGEQPSSTTAFFSPPRPAELTVTVPCAAVRAGAERDGPTTVFATGVDGTGLGVRTGSGRVSVELAGRVLVTDAVGTSADCAIGVLAGPTGVVVTHGGARTELAAEPVPEVTSFRTDLGPAAAAGLAVTATTAVTPWQSTPTPLKVALLVLALALVGASLGMLRRIGVRTRNPAVSVGSTASAGPAAASPALLDRPAVDRALLDRPALDRPAVDRALLDRPSLDPALLDPVAVRARAGGRWRRWLVDAGVLGTLAGWAVIGPVTDDDGFATAIARTVAATGDAGNYYRWWNASESPFALTQQLLAPLTEVSLAPLWLRLPSLLLGIATWFVVSRGVLGSTLPSLAASGRVRLLAAVCFLAAWLPFNLGTRPEPYVALGTAAVLALLLRARSVAGLGAAAVVAGVTLPASPAAVLVLAPVVALAPRIVRLLRVGARGRTDVLARLALLAGVGCVGLVVVFADQSWRGVAAATELHNRFGPSLAWHEEIVRYLYLLGFDSQGSAAKRVPVLLALVLLVAVAVLIARRRAAPQGPQVRVLACSVAVGFALLCLVPSKWSHHFGALAGLIAPFLVAAVVLLARAAGNGAPRWFGPAAGAGVAVAAAVAFAGPNAWFQPVNYSVPWADGPIQPLGLPLDSPVFWLGTVGIAAAVRLAARRLHRARATLAAAPALITVLAASTSLAVLLGSFAAASARDGYTLAAANLDQLTGRASCGIADHVDVLPDVPGGALTPVLAGTPVTPFSWDSRAPDATSTGELTSPWFALPVLRADQEVALDVSGRVGEGTTLTLEFGASGQPRAAVAPQEPPIPDPPPDGRGRALQRTPATTASLAMSVAAAQVPAGADQVRIRAVDAATDRDGWLAVAAPRLRDVVGLTDYLQSIGGPVLVDWPIAFALPCQLDTPAVAGGLAQAPVAIVEASRRYPPAELPTDPQIGGSFAALRTQGRLTEVPTRLRGSPDVDWGHLVLIDYGSARDAYSATPANPG